MAPKNEMRPIDAQRAATRRLAYASVGCALQIVILYLGALLDVLDISAAALAGFVNVWAVIELGSFYPWVMWAVTATVSLLLLPAKAPAVLYLLLAGYYPMLKNLFEKCNKVISWALKIVVFNAALALTLFVCIKFLGMEDAWGGKMTAVLFAVGNPTFVIYDIAATRLIRVYLHVWRKKMHIKI